MMPQLCTDRAATPCTPHRARRCATRPAAPTHRAGCSPGALPCPGIRAGHKLPTALLRLVLAAVLFHAVLSLALVAPSTAWAMPQARVLLGGQAFHVDVADTPALQQRGLGGRTALGPLEGMLFPYVRRGQPSFWMRGMLIPIDIIWIDSDRIVYIAHRVPPPAPGTPLEQLPTYAPRDPANLVLEIAAGRAQALGVRVGDRVTLEF